MAAVQRLQHVSVPMPPDGAGVARRFYGAALGMEEIPRPADLRALTLVWFRASADGQELHCFAEERLGPNSPGQHLCLQVDDLAGFRRRLAEHGVAVEETIPIRNRPRCFVRDPFGNLIELTEIVGDYTV
jgi:catechol 2,3-dioxygenase-like lactoylglutathione lyase family enzyme